MDGWMIETREKNMKRESEREREREHCWNSTDQGVFVGHLKAKEVLSLHSQTLVYCSMRQIVVMLPTSNYTCSTGGGEQPLFPVYMVMGRLGQERVGMINCQGCDLKQRRSTYQYVESQNIRSYTVDISVVIAFNKDIYLVLFLLFLLTKMSLIPKVRERIAVCACMFWRCMDCRAQIGS